MSEWKKTSCVLCYQNCGLEVTTEGSRIIQVRADRDNPRSQGYVCRKGANIAYFQNNPERLRFPLKRIGDRFKRISWNQALDEIADRLTEIVQTHNPRQTSRPFCCHSIASVYSLQDTQDLRVDFLKLRLVLQHPAHPIQNPFPQCHDHEVLIGMILVTQPMVAGT